MQSALRPTELIVEDVGLGNALGVMLGEGDLEGEVAGFGAVGRFVATGTIFHNNFLPFLLHNNFCPVLLNCRRPIVLQVAPAFSVDAARTAGI